ncbi:hypothetical protein [Burkholderia cenocepacia]|nr:hypothetical protein [Burkholderia cenocepacia]
MKPDDQEKQEPVPFSLDTPEAGFDEGVMRRDVEDKVEEGDAGK